MAAKAAPAAKEPAAEVPESAPTSPPAPIQESTGPRPPKRVREVDVPEYPGFKLTIWVNHPQILYDQMLSGENTASLAAANEIFIAHNGWCDFNGKPYPSIGTDEFWAEIPNELAATMLALVRKEAAELPNSLLRMRPR
jgi:hypothetical protein